jgi:hypothetical protein
VCVVCNKSWCEPIRAKLIGGPLDGVEVDVCGLSTARELALKTITGTEIPIETDKCREKRAPERVARYVLGYVRHMAAPMQYAFAGYGPCQMASPAHAECAEVPGADRPGGSGLEELAAIVDRTCPSCGASMVPQADGTLLCIADAGVGICGVQFAPCRCVKCGCDGPMTQVDADHPGWLCPGCYAQAI